MLGKFKFHPVGQGLFYSGVIQGPSGEFKIVYDCGADPLNKYELQHEISRFNNKVNNGTIDLLVISHFDYDHVSGLNNLISGKKIKKIIMPYYPPHHIQFLKYLAIINKIEDDDYLRFLNDPIGFFKTTEGNIFF